MVCTPVLSPPSMMRNQKHTAETKLCLLEITNNKARKKQYLLTIRSMYNTHPTFVRGMFPWWILASQPAVAPGGAVSQPTGTA